MSIRFRRSVTIFPGVQLNFGKSGISLSFGRRGATVTVGQRGTYGNVGLPGTGLSYRTRVDVPGPHEPLTTHVHPGHQSDVGEKSFESRLRSLLRDRERGAIDWHARALWLAELAPDDEDEEAFEEFARRVSAGRFARRMVDGDRAAWAEVLREELINEDLPFDFGFEWGIDEQLDRICLGVELPPVNLIGATGLRPLRLRELHEDVCCALVLRVIHEVYRTIPEADDVYVVGFQMGSNPATGDAVREVYLRIATDRASFDEILLDQVDPSAAFEHLGGVSKRRRGELQPLSIEPPRGT